MRIFTGAIQGEKYVLEGDAHRHVAYALRSKTGDKITLCPQDGCDYDGVIEKIEKEKTTVRILSRAESSGEPKCEVSVYFGVPHKSDKLDLIVQKLTELGVKRIQPIMTRFVQANEKSVRADRLLRIAEEASKQCGRGIVPNVCTPISFDEMCAQLSDFDLVLFPYEEEKALSAKEYLDSALKEKSVNKAAVIIGSEGGFAPEEALTLARMDIPGVTLGKRILRAETACIAATAVLMYELGELS